MRNLIIVAVWLGIGFGITEFVASYLEASRAQPTAHKLNDATPDARNVQAAVPNPR